MTLDDLIRLMSDFLSKFKVDHFTFGAVAMNFWIPPRFTNDLDMVFCIKKGVLLKLVTELNGLGFKVTANLRRKIGEGRVVHLPIGDTRLDVKICTAEHDYAALERAETFVRGPYTLRIATAEDIVLYKLQSWRSQDQTDIKKIVAEYDPLDREYIDDWLDKIEVETGYPVVERWDAVLLGA